MERQNHSLGVATTTTRGKDTVEAKTRWQKPEVQEISCGLEINCYATPTGRR